MKKLFEELGVDHQDFIEKLALIGNWVLRDDPTEAELVKRLVADFDKPELATFAAWWLGQEIVISEIRAYQDGVLNAVNQSLGLGKVTLEIPISDLDLTKPDNEQPN